MTWEGLRPGGLRGLCTQSSFHCSEPEPVPKPEPEFVGIFGNDSPGMGLGTGTGSKFCAKPLAGLRAGA